MSVVVDDEVWVVINVVVMAGVGVVVIFPQPAATVLSNNAITVKKYLMFHPNFLFSTN